MIAAAPSAGNDFIFSEILQILQIGSVLFGGIFVAVRLGRASGRIEAAMAMQATEITTLKDEVKVLSGLVTQVAVQNTRIDLLEKRYEELRHGEGFVFPLSAHLRAAT